MGIDRLPSGRYRARANVGGRAASATFQTRTEAERWEKAARSARAYSRAGLKPPTEDEATLARPRTLRTLIEALAQEQGALGRSPKTIAGTKFVLKTLSRTGLDALAVPLDREWIVRIIDSMRTAHATNGRLVTYVLSVIGTAHRRAGLTPPLMPQVPVRRKGRPRLAIDELQRLLAALPSGSPERLHALLIVLTGCRESEARRLDWTDVDLERQVLQVHRLKGWRSGEPSSEPSPIPPLLAAELALVKEVERTGTLLKLDGLPLKEQTLRKRIEAAHVRAGLPKRSGLAYLRNAASRLLGEDGTAVELTRRWLGHSSVTTTEKHYEDSIRWNARVELGAQVERIVTGRHAKEPKPAKPSGTKRLRKRGL